jgi:hypothetical protein
MGRAVGTEAGRDPATARLSAGAWPVASAWLVAAIAVVFALVAAAAVGRERRRGRERERLLREALQGTASAASLGTLLTSFAHAGNNRLTVILACLDVIEAAGLDDEDQRAAVRLALGGARQLADDLGALLTGGRRDTRSREPRDVAAALADGRELHALLGERPLPMSVVVAPGLAVECEPGRLELAVLRLCVLAQRCHAAAVEVRGAELELQARDARWPSLRPGRYCKLEFTFDGATLPDLLLETPAEPGHVVGRLREPQGLEFAAVEAFAVALRGVASARVTGPTVATVVDLVLPLAPVPAP